MRTLPSTAPDPQDGAQTTACVPKTCAQLGKNCGTVDNCGEPLSCGTCTNPYQTCGGNGTPNVCGCKPKPQAQACVGRCIFAPDGCGGNINPLYGIGYAATVEPSQSNMGYISTLKTAEERAQKLEERASADSSSGMNGGRTAVPP